MMDTRTLTMTVIAAIAFLIVAGVAVWAILRYQRTKRLEKHFGPEYERALLEARNRREAEKELDARLHHVKSLEIRSLTEDEMEHFALAWRSIQARFIDEPATAIRDADQLIKQLMIAKGYPVEHFDQRAADVSVDYPELVQHYRSLRQIADRSRHEAISTEEMRQAMVDCRALFEELLGTKVNEYAYEKERI